VCFSAYAVQVSELQGYLHRYWVRFGGDVHALPAGSRLGFGVTAVDRSDAQDLIKEVVFGSQSMPAPAEIVEDVDARDLDLRHVIPNMGDPSVRGVRFPRL
jgi:hypothetical protein